MTRTNGHTQFHGLYEHTAAWKKLLVTLLLLFLMFIPVSMFTYLLFGTGGFDYDNEMQVQKMRWAQLAQSTLLFALPALLAAWLFSGRPGRYLYTNRTAATGSYFLVLPLMATALPVINLLGELNLSMELPGSMSAMEDFMRELEDTAMQQTEAFLRVRSPGLLAVNLLVMALAPAVTEELLFRGVFQRLFIAWTGQAITGIIIAAAFFSAFHMQFFGFLPRFFLGVLLGLLFHWGRSLWLPILAHFANNAIVVMAYYYIYNHGTMTEVETAGTPEGSTLLLAWGSLFFLVLALLIYRTEKMRKTIPTG
jgi:hypothetical protein